DMGKIVKVALFSLMGLLTSFSLIVIVVYAMAVSDLLQDDAEVLAGAAYGMITIVNKDADTEQPIPYTVFTVVDGESGEVVEQTMTDESGVGITGLLPYGKTYEIRQTKVMAPYRLDERSHLVQLSAD